MAENITTDLFSLIGQFNDTVLFLILIAASFCLTVLLLRPGKRRRETKVSGRATTANQELSLKLSDLNSRVSVFQTRVSSELAELRLRLKAVEQKLGIEGEELPRAEPEPEHPPKVEGGAPAIPATVSGGLEKTRSSLFTRLTEFFAKKSEAPEEFYSRLEEILLSSDLGVKCTQLLIERLKAQVQNAGAVTEEALTVLLKQNIREILRDGEVPSIVPRKRQGLPLVVAIVGVNGVGKTTTIGKIAHQFAQSGARVLVAACDTFRAAAKEQLEFWAEKAGAQIISGAPDGKPSTVAYQAVHRAKGKNFDVLLVDTAGRLHTRTNLMQELKNVIQLISREQSGAPHETLLVLDASTGQNALQQAREFNEACALTGIIITKLDGTPKGGIVVAIKQELGIPIRYIGVGEGIDDLKPFSADEFVEALFNVPAENSDQPAAQTERGQARRKRRQDREQSA